jgi:hypothetical protein
MLALVSRSLSIKIVKPLGPRGRHLLPNIRQSSAGIHIVMGAMAGKIFLGPPGACMGVGGVVAGVQVGQVDVLGGWGGSLGFAFAAVIRQDHVRVG